MTMTSGITAEADALLVRIRVEALLDAIKHRGELLRLTETPEGEFIISSLHLRSPRAILLTHDGWLVWTWERELASSIPNGEWLARRLPGTEDRVTLLRQADQDARRHHERWNARQTYSRG